MALATSFRGLVNSEFGLIDRKIFVDEEIYQQELEQIFGRCWLYVAHESQVPKPNDFIASRMAEDPILVTRDAKGNLHTFLNMCRHRGNRVCRADEGNSPSFMCTYHGWTFATDGKLVGVPGYKEAYFEELDRTQWGLVEARTTSYKGLVFATWDASAPPLLEYLGDMAWCLDLSLDNSDGGSELLRGVQKAILPCNWKYPCDNNGGDGYHNATTHRGSDMVRTQFETGDSGSSQTSQTPRRGGGRTIYWGNGHCGGLRPDFQFGAIEKYRRALVPDAIKRLGEFRVRNGGVRTTTCTLFPNFSYSSTSIRMLHPQGPHHIEEWSWVLVDRNAPQEVKDEMRKHHILAHGPSGIREEEDLNNFMNCTETARSLTGRKYLQNLQLGLGHGTRDETYPGFAYAMGGVNEVNQRFFYGRWAEMMDAPSWNQITIDPITYQKVSK